MIKNVIIVMLIAFLMFTSCFAEEKSGSIDNTFESWFEWYAQRSCVDDPALEDELLSFAYRELVLMFPSLSEQQIRHFTSSPVYKYPGHSYFTGEYDDGYWSLDIMYRGIESTGITFDIVRDENGSLQIIHATPWKMDKLANLMDSCITKEEALVIAKDYLQAAIIEHLTLHPILADRLIREYGSDFAEPSHYVYHVSFHSEFNQGAEGSIPYWWISLGLGIVPEAGDDWNVNERLCVLEIDAKTGDILNTSIWGFLLDSE